MRSRHSLVLLLLLAATATGFSCTLGERRVVNTRDRLGPYSEAVVTGNLAFLSGQIGIDPTTGKLVEGGVEAETEQVLINLRRVAETAGLDLSRAVRAEVYVTDIADYATVNAIYGRTFAQEPPARTCVQVAALPGGAHVEIAVTVPR